MKYATRRWKAILVVVILAVLAGGYRAMIREAVMFRYFRSWDGKESRYLEIHFCGLLPCFFARCVFDPQDPAGRYFGKKISFPAGILEPKIIDFGPKNRPRDPNRPE